MRKRILVLLAVFSLFTCSGNLMAKERRGAELVIQKLDGQQVKGELIAVKQTSLLLLDSQLGADVSVLIKDVDVIKIMKKSKKLIGAGLGFLVGVGVGALGGLLGWELFNWAPQDTKTRDRIVAAAGAGGGLAGALVGGIVGANTGHTETIQIAGRSQEEVNLVLMKLRSKARITNLQ